MEKICLVIDFDGFHIRDKFHVREFGFTSVPDCEYGSIKFNLKHLVDKMNNKDWKTVNYVKYNISGLTLKPRHMEHCLEEEDLEKRLLQLYDNYKTAERDVIAYKGGNVEEYILKKLNIPYLDLQNLGCPKYDILPPVPIEDCGFHLQISNKAFHCPMQETFAFALWVIKKSKRKHK